MSMFGFLGDFFLSEWIWSITWGLSHIPINMIVMFILTKLTLRIRNISLFFLLALAHIFAIVMFTAFVVGIMIFIIGLNYLPSESAYSESYNPFIACIALGLIYAFLQSIFFVMVNKRFTINMRSMVAIAVMSNLASAQIVYLLFPYK